ncbi:Crp/Fnr family transcriptional regulator [Paenibacillus methanolicus]|uniref:CRP/FNR family transcriptional regulator n=1 Tax=Paenibacillus methanolicus TaxID=582686 RepID=A0A5S5C8C1_9BACL|nr:Crp/Fnr family transcriptional regulator [Paenibacillus methanolicus]TYP74848.1 CRP/FNR family transcriptional regulator [Paenibacillus methanolicus]
MPQQSLDLPRIQRLFPCFGTVPDDDWREAEVAQLSPDTTVAIREGHIFRHAVFVLSGWVRVYKISPSGREITLYRLTGGQCCVLMLASILGDLEYEASIAIESDTEALLLPVDTFRSWTAVCAPVRRYVYGQFVERMSNVTRLLEQIAFEPVPCRLAGLLLANAADRKCLPVTHEALAIELGTAREVVSRTLKEFAARGAVALGRGSITIIDREELSFIRDRQT